MRKLIAGFLLAAVLVGPKPCYALTLEDLKTQIIDQTKVTILKSGGPASFYDLSMGNSNAFRVGVVDHVLTNRFIQADLGWANGTDGNTGGILVGGPSLVVTDAFAYIFSDVAASLKPIIPPALLNLYFGANLGWGTDNGAAHYGLHFGYNF